MEFEEENWIFDITGLIIDGVTRFCGKQLIKFKVGICYRYMLAFFLHFVEGGLMFSISQKTAGIVFCSTSVLNIFTGLYALPIMKSYNQTAQN